VGGVLLAVLVEVDELPVRLVDAVFQVVSHAAAATELLPSSIAAECYLNYQISRPARGNLLVARLSGFHS